MKAELFSTRLKSYADEGNATAVKIICVAPGGPVHINDIHLACAHPNGDGSFELGSLITPPGSMQPQDIDAASPQEAQETADAYNAIRPLDVDAILRELAADTQAQTARNVAITYDETRPVAGTIVVNNVVYIYDGGFLDEAVSQTLVAILSERRIK